MTQPRAVAYLYVCAGDAPPGTAFNIFTSPDAQTWTARNINAPTNAGLRDIVYGAGRFVALGYHNGYVNDAGWAGRTYRIEYTDSLPALPNDWQPLQTLQLPDQTVLLTDPAMPNEPQRFYRGVLLE